MARTKLIVHPEDGERKGDKIYNKKTKNWIKYGGVAYKKWLAEGPDKPDQVVSDNIVNNIVDNIVNNTKTKLSVASSSCKRLCYRGQKREYVCKKSVYRKKVCYYHFCKTYPFTPRRRVFWTKK